MRQKDQLDCHILMGYIVICICITGKKNNKSSNHHVICLRAIDTQNKSEYSSKKKALKYTAASCPDDK